MAHHDGRTADENTPSAAQGEVTQIPVVTTFAEMELHPALLRGIYSQGFEKPSWAQQRAIVPMIRGDDLVVHAGTCTGKTSALAIGLLQRCDFTCGSLQGLVLSPTRELAQATHAVISSIGDFLSDGAPFCATFVGGTRVHDDLKKLQAGIIIAVGTPGRVADVIKRGALRTEMLKVLVLDEADVMLSLGFSEQIYDIFNYLSKDVQVALFSATMPDDVLELTKKFMRNPTNVRQHHSNPLTRQLKHFYIAVEEDHKLETLMDLYESVSIAQSVIFANTRRKVDYIKDQLDKHNHTVSYMHADMQPGERDKEMYAFRTGSSRVLVTTDLAVRGFDVPHVDMVINYDLPENKENYRGRVDPGGKYARKGIAINFVSPSDVASLRELEEYYEIQIEELPADFAAHVQ
jgi:translation initiation factor 4A